MKEENKFIKELKKIKFSNFVFLFIAGIINSIGVTLFLAPASLYDSGISGTSMLFWQLTPDQFTLSLFLVVLNIPLFLIGLKKTGIQFYDLFHIYRNHIFRFLLYHQLHITDRQYECIAVCRARSAALRNFRRINLRYRQRAGNTARRRHGRN